MSKKRALKIFASIVSVIVIVCLMNFVLVPPMYDHWANRDRKVNEDKVDTVFLGDSLGLYSVQPTIYDEEFNSFSYNACTACQDFSDSYYLLLDYIKSFSKLKKVILMLDYYNFSEELNYGISSRIVQYNRIESPRLKIRYILDVCPVNDLYNVVLHKTLYDTNPKKIAKNLKIKTGSVYRNYGILSDEESFYLDKGYVCTYMTNENTRKENEYDASKINNKSLDYFKRIIKLCKDNGISLSVIHSPITLYRMSLLKNYDVLYATVKKTCDLFEVKYFDFNYPLKVMNLDDIMDFKDNSHLNYDGSIKFMEYFCEILSTN